MAVRLPLTAYEAANQSPPYVDVDLYGSDRPLQDAVRANGADGESPALAAFGRRWGAAAMFERARAAERNPPELKIYDARGFRRDFVGYHPAYHQFMTESVSAGLHASTWQDDARAAPAPAQVARAARFYMAAQIETGHLCPITMTHAAVAALKVEPALIEKFMPKIGTRTYDAQFRPWWEKTGVTLGMGMTERQGGTDVRANTTRAEPADGAYAITGQKWFMSAPMCDAFLVLAQAPHGLTCFLMPRFRPDGSVNAIHFQRLKDKLGNRSNASSEVEFAGAFAWRLGDEGRGVRTIINMVQLTRLDCAIASAGLMRMALAQALHHARYRTVFQKRLIDQPLMQAVLADMALDVEAATGLALRLAGSFDRAADAAQEAARARLLTPAVKYWVCKTASGLIGEAMECLGGNGYVEESLLPRLYREAPVNAIWEGSGNVMCLDVLRALAQDAEAAHGVLEGLAAETADLPGARDTADFLKAALTDASGEARARAVVDRLARLAAAAALHAAAPPMVAELFARTRLAENRRTMYGTGDIASDEARHPLERALPAA
jgi:putative acyl-CoA dehydrogenase